MTFGQPCFGDIKAMFEIGRKEQDERARAFAESRALGPLDLTNTELRKIKINPINKAPKGAILALLTKDLELLKKMIADGMSSGEIAREMTDRHRVMIYSSSVQDAAKAHKLVFPQKKSAMDYMRENKEKIVADLNNAPSVASVAIKWNIKFTTFHKGLKKAGIQKKEGVYFCD